jgi:hypothetical protein
LSSRWAGVLLVVFEASDRRIHVLPAVLVGGLFVWAALKDGQEDKAFREGERLLAATA